MFTLTTRNITTDAIMNIVSIAYGPGKWTRRKAFCLSIQFMREDCYFGDCYHELVET